MPVLLTYRHQSIDLHCKSVDWFLYEGNTDIQCVKQGVGKLQQFLALRFLNTPLYVLVL